MAEYTCPHCGKPIRPGARFCGNCGNSIDLPDKRLAQASAATEESSASWSQCPHCGNPVRPGAKFCNNCGNVIPAEMSSFPAPVQEQVSPMAGSPITSMDVSEAGIADKDSKTETREPKKRRSAVPVLIVGLFVACLAIVAGAYIFYPNLFNLFGGSFRAQTTVTTSPLPSSAATGGITQVAVASSPVPSSTPTVAEIVVTTIPTQKPIPTPTNIQTSVWLADDFDTALKDNWTVWVKEGSSHRPKIDQGPGEKYLFLSSDVTPGEAGITSKSLITMTVGLDIQFIGQIFDDIPGYVLVLDWDSIDQERGPDLTQPGEIHLEIMKDSLTFAAPLDSDVPCKVSNVGTEEHTYRIFLSEEGNLELFVDSSSKPVCGFDLQGIESQPGRITFSGIGWVSKVQVTGPADTQ